jgi:alkanesulfonate monooxygenase SsuD/methylene tetrahydromethanopterin reductase-like flavin-dependent oxidoreductase (luciferase family)
VRVAAEIGMIDSLSQGRLVIGVGSGYQPFEFERFGLDLADSKAMFTESLAIIEQGLTQEFVEFHGKHYDLPKTHISARPYGKLPEIWLAGDSAPLRALAAEKGYPIMTNGRLADAVTVGRRRADYEAPFIEAGKVPGELKWGLLRFCCVTDSKADALEYAENARWQLRLASALRRREEILDGHMLVGSQPLPNEPSLEEIVASQMIGDVETCIARGVAEIRNSRPAHVSLYFQVGDYDHKRAMRSMELFFSQVVPGIEREVGPLSEIGQ